MSDSLTKYIAIVCLQLSVIFASCRGGHGKDPKRFALLATGIYREAISQKRVGAFPDRELFHAIATEFWKNHSFADSRGVLIFPNRMDDKGEFIVNTGTLGILSSGNKCFLLRFDHERNFLSLEDTKTSISDFRESALGLTTLDIIFHGNRVVLEWTQGGSESCP